jgi:putative thioredoxin
MGYSENVVNVQEATFQEAVIQKSHEKPVVVDFWAAWCGPCRMLGPVLERLASEPESGFVLAKVDVDANPGLAMRYGIQGIPAVKAFVDGQVADEFVGAQPEPMVRQFLSNLAPSEEEQGIRSAQELLSDRSWKEAEERFREMLETESSNGTATFGLAQALIGQGLGCEAESYLDELKYEPTYLESVERLLILAQYLCIVAQKDDEGAELTVVESQYRHAAHLFTQGNYSAALDGLLEVLRYNKDYRDGQAKAVLLGIFELFGDEDPLTNIYRREMASVLF